MNDHDNPAQETQTINAEARLLKSGNIGQTPMFTSAPMPKNYAYYLTICRKGTTAIEHYDRQLAYATGYISALHKGRIYADSIIPISMIEKYSDAVFEDIFKEVAAFRRKTVPDMDDRYICVLGYEEDGDGYEGKQAYVTDLLCKDFIDGYVDAFRVAGKYDHVFRTYDNCNVNDDTVRRIFCDLVIYGHADEDDRRASARIIMREFGLNADELRAMLSEDSSVNDSGEPVG